MSTLQKNFIYGGDLKKSPVKNVGLNFNFPRYQYIEVNAAGSELVTREIVTTESFTLDKELSSKEYQVKLPDNFIIPQEEDLTIFRRFLIQSLRSKKLDNFTTTITVDYLLDSKNQIGNKTFDALYFFRHEVHANFAVLQVSDIEFDFESLILINKEAFFTLLKRLSKITSPPEELNLLAAILSLVENTAEYPFVVRQVTDEIRTNIFQLLKTDNPEALDLIMKSFPELFDFPIAIPEIKFMEVAGTFAIITNDRSKITKAQLSSYTLSLEYSITEGHQSAYQTINFDLVKAGDKIQNNTVNFAFTENAKVILNNIQNPVSVNVKGFDGSVLWSRQFRPDAPELKELRIEVPLMQPVKLTGSAVSQTNDRNKKLRGQVISYSKECSLKDVTVIVQVTKRGSDNWTIAGSAKSDNSGNFFMPYPYGNFTAARAIVSIAPNDPVSIGIIQNDTDETISDDFIYLLVTAADCPPVTEEEDCDCHSPKKAARLPDQEDLIRSDEYSQDLGGGCINLSTPNRTLREYTYQAIVRTSDPGVANYTLRKVSNNPKFPEYASLIKYSTTTELIPGAKPKHNPIEWRFELVPGVGKITRKPIDLDNPIKWQDAPDEHENLSIYQAVTIATGHILHYKSKFKADGYSLGDLLYSLALAPGQKKEIVVFDATHTLLGSETQQTTQRESLAASLVNERAVTDTLGGTINESMQGQSHSTNSGISAGGGLGFSYGGFGASLGVSGGTSTADSSGSQNSGRDVSQSFAETLQQSIMQNAESYRQLNSSVITTVKENQRYAATTEVVANHNHCHALTILYFEILRHFAVYQELASVEECVFVPFLMTNFSVDNIYKWRDVLAPNLLPMPSNTYLSSLGFGGNFQHPLLKGFDANERIKSEYANVDFPPGAYNEERITNIKGTINIRVHLEKPKTRYDRIKSFPKSSTDLSGKDFFDLIADGLFGKTSGVILDEYVTVDANYRSVPPRDCIRVVKFDDKFFEQEATQDNKLWVAYAFILPYAGNVSKMLEHYFKGTLISEWDDIFNNQMSPVVFEKLLQSLNFRPMAKGGISCDFSSPTKYKGGERVMEVRFNGNTGLRRMDFAPDLIFFSGDSQITDLRDYDLVTVFVEDARIYYSTPHYNGTLFSGYLGDDLFDDARLFIPENSDEKRNPKNEDIFIVNKLIEHLNSNLEYYNKVLWYRLDPDRRYMLLDGFGIELYNKFGAKLSDLRSLASVVKNQLITVTGNSLVFPVAEGYKVSSSFIVEESPVGNREEVSLFDYYKPLTPIPPYRISVPTRGVFAETLQSYCNACEKIETDRLQDWNKFPNTDEPTPFAPITVPTPTVTDWKAAFKDFAPPMINIQNAPALPAPGAGLAGLSELLGKTGVFKDITGLDATQQNAIKTYLSNQDNAKAFAEMAKELALQDHNTQHSDKITDSLKAAKDSGAISQEDYSKLTKEHLQKQIDGSSTTDSAKNNETSLSKAAVDAASNGKDVKATKTDSKSGLVETLEVAGPPASTTAGTDVLIVRLIVPQASNPTLLKTFDPTTDSVGFAAFDGAFDTATPNTLKPDFIDKDSHRFFIEIYDSKVSPSTQTIEVDWTTVFTEKGQLYDLSVNTKLTLTRDTTRENYFRSKALVLVHEEIDLTVVVDGKKAGDNEFRIRLAGMFAFIRIQYKPRTDTEFTFPVFNPKSLRQVPIHIFTLRNSTNNPVATADKVGDSIASLQDVYDNVGLLFNASSEYTFSGNALAQKIPTPSVSKRNINYKVNEITVPSTINVNAIKLADLITITNSVPPAPNKLRIFVIGQFDHSDPNFATADVLAMAMNNSFASGKGANLENCLFVEARATGKAGFPYTIAHEIGHILMDKKSFLLTHTPPLPLPADHKFDDHYRSDNARLPGEQNLMNPVTDVSSVFAPKRIWNVADADKYNQFADLMNDRMKLMK